MHKSGIILAWLAILLATGATLLTSKLIQVRNSWARKADSLRKEAVDLEPKVPAAKTELTRLQNELQRVGHGWGTTYERNTQVVRPNEGVVQAQLGTADGVRDKQFLYGFEILADGSSVFRGEFAVNGVAETASTLRPNWRVRAEDVVGWQNALWRWRTQVPAGYIKGYEDQEVSLVRAEEILFDRAQTLQLHEQLVSEAQVQLQRRIAELVGGAELSTEPALDTEYRLGLVAAAIEVEELRNADLLEVDRLRHEVRSAELEIRQLQEENRKLGQQLPQPAAQLTARPDTPQP